MNYISVTPSMTASILIPGYMMDRTSNVYLSSNTVSIPGSAVVINNFTTNHLVSSLFPAFTGYNYPFFSALSHNFLTVNVFGLSGTGYVDVIIYNRAGYTKLSDKNWLVAFNVSPSPLSGNVLTYFDSSLLYNGQEITYTIQ